MATLKYFERFKKLDNNTSSIATANSMATLINYLMSVFGGEKSQSNSLHPKLFLPFPDVVEEDIDTKVALLSSQTFKIVQELVDSTTLPNLIKLKLIELIEGT